MVLAILSSLWGGCVTVGTLTVQCKENTLMAKRDGGQVSGIAPDDSGHNEASSELLRELVAHLRQNRKQLRCTTATWRPSRRKLSRRCRPTREIFPNASFREASKRTKLLESFSCFATSSHALSSPSTRRISRN